jgi:DNA invertase Pin-like site-specific DNA recombinase
MQIVYYAHQNSLTGNMRVNLMQNSDAKVEDEMTVYGYARVSSKTQCFDGQVDALRAAGCQKIVSEKMTGKDINGRKALQALLAKVREGDVIVVVKLDRFARSTKDLLTMVEDLKDRGVGFKSLGEPWCDTTSAHGKLMLTILGGMAEFERELIRQRCAAGIERAKEHGVKFGRRPVLNPHQRAEARRLLAEGHTQRSIARLLGVDQATISRMASSAEEAQHV